MKQFVCSISCVESDGLPCKTDDPSGFQCPIGEVNTMKLIPGTMTRRDILQDINKERARQDGKWGFPQNNNLAEWGIILGEEVGEVMQAMNEVRFRNEDTAHLLEELIQVAAVAVSIIEHMTMEVAGHD